MPGKEMNIKSRKKTSRLNGLRERAGGLKKRADSSIKSGKKKPDAGRDRQVTGKTGKDSGTQLWQLFAAFFRIGILTFGGGYAMLPMFRRECVERYGWVTDEEMLDLYAISQCTPGIIAVNAATYIGYKERKVRGSVASTAGVVTPSLIIICLVASILKKFISHPVVAHAFAGIRIAVCALLITTVITLVQKGVKDIPTALIGLAALAVALYTPVPLVVIVILAGLAGYLISLIPKAEQDLSNKKGGRS